MNNTIVDNIKKTFRREFEKEPEFIVRSPGRINLIGEHTDYNLGYVLPAAVDKGIYIAIGIADSPDLCRFVSIDQQETFELSIGEYHPVVEQKWFNYILGVAFELIKLGKGIRGFNLVFSGDLPQGAGMSSSAALECGTAIGLNALFGLNLDKKSLISVSQKAEHNYVGVMCGIMDQFASVMGKKDQVIQLDCRSLDYEYFPLSLNEYSLLLCNSNVSHNLANSEYNVRRQQCEEGVAVLQNYYSEVGSLRDVTMEMLTAHKVELSGVTFRRCKYVVEENDRVKAFCEALKQQDLNRVNQLLVKAQQAMETEYEITCPEIDFMAGFANQKAEVKGSRMMGGGFGGCTINVVKDDYKKQFTDELAQAYQDKFDIKLHFYNVNIENGSHILANK